MSWYIKIVWLVGAVMVCLFLGTCADKAMSNQGVCVDPESGGFVIEPGRISFKVTGCDGYPHEWSMTPDDVTGV